MKAVQTAAVDLGVVAATDALGVSRASYYRWLSPWVGPPQARRRPRALSPDERKQALAITHEDRFEDRAPAQIVATLLDEKRYVCSTRTMYRLLEQNAEVRERRDQRRHPTYAVPELLASAPNTLWSWDITKLLGPAKWTYFYLYVILDVFSRYVVGWMVAEQESAVLAKKLIAETVARQNIEPGTLTVHADRGSSMTSKPVALLLADLGITKTHSRPHVSNDNPYSEAQFKTLKYMPGFPDRFGCKEDARAFLVAFFSFYNTVHRHSGIAMMTPHDVHHGLATAVRDARQTVLDRAFQQHPERFVKGSPKAHDVPKDVWINPPMNQGVAPPDPRPSSLHLAEAARVDHEGK